MSVLVLFQSILNCFQKYLWVPQRRRWAFIGNSGGMTLVEILIVLGIIAGIVSFSTSFIGNVSGDGVREEASRLMRVVHYVYQQATISNRYLRLSFDLDNQKYVVEASEEPFYVVQEGDEIEALRLENEERNQLGNDEDEKEENKAATFSAIDDENLEEHVLSEGVKIKDFQALHQKESVAEGKNYLYFFPRGQTEFAVFHLSDADGDNVVTLAVNPISGEVTYMAEEQSYDDALAAMGGS